MCFRGSFKLRSSFVGHIGSFFLVWTNLKGMAEFICVAWIVSRWVLKCYSINCSSLNLCFIVDNERRLTIFHLLRWNKTETNVETCLELMSLHMDGENKFDLILLPKKGSIGYRKSFKWTIQWNFIVTNNSKPDIVFENNFNGHLPSSLLLQLLLSSRCCAKGILYYD